MPSYDEVREMFESAQTPEEKAEAMRALQEHIPEGMNANHMVTMSKGGVNAVRLGDISGQSNNDDIFNRIKKMLGGLK